WATPALANRLAPAASNAMIDADFPFRFFTVHPRSGLVAVARGAQALALRQEPVTQLRLILSGFDMFGQQPAPQISARRGAGLAVDLDVKTPGAKGRGLRSGQPEGAV